MACMDTQKSDAVLDSWLIICVLFTTNCCKKAMNVLGRNWSQTAKLRSTSCCTVNIVLYGGTVLYGRTPSFQTDRTCTVLYGVLRYGTVITVKKAEVRRISTSLYIYAPYTSVYLVILLPKIPCVHRIYIWFWQTLGVYVQSWPTLDMCDIIAASCT